MLRGDFNDATDKVTAAKAKLLACEKKHKIDPISKKDKKSKADKAKDAKT